MIGQIFFFQKCPYINLPTFVILYDNIINLKNPDFLEIVIETIFSLFYFIIGNTNVLKCSYKYFEATVIHLFF